MREFLYRNQDLPDTFQNLFIPTTYVHTYQTRHSSNSLLLARTRTSRHQFNIAFRGPKLWSELSSLLRSTSSHSSFKTQIPVLILLQQILINPLDRGWLAFAASFLDLTCILLLVLFVLSCFVCLAEGLACVSWDWYGQVWNSVQAWGFILTLHSFVLVRNLC